jgi:spore coat assembly protein SafA
MSVSSAGLDLVKNAEGLSLTAYKDSGGVWTIGYGHTAGVKPGEKITPAQAQQYLKDDMATAENAVRNDVKVPLTQGQFDALVSLTYNVGAGALQSSTLLKKLNAGDYAGAQAQFGKWVYGQNSKGNEVILPGLVTRRQNEADLFGSKGPQGADSGNGVSTTSPTPSSNRSASASSHYRVKSGDTLSAIAAAHGVSLKSLEAANPQIRNPNLIYPGQKINIPGGGGVKGSVAANSSNQSASTSNHYRVKSGDTLSAIAAAHGVSLKSLEAANPQIRNPNLIYPGQNINIPGGGSVESSTPTNTTNSSNGSSNVAQTAESFLGQMAANLEKSGQLPMQSGVDSKECCANFVSAVLVKTGLLPSNMQTASVETLKENLQKQGWTPVNKAEAKPGDVMIVQTGSESHTEIVASNDNGKITLIGSNNTNPDKTQQVGYDAYTANNVPCTIYAPPN